MEKSWGSLLLIALCTTHCVAAGKLLDRSVNLPVTERILPLRRLSSSQLSGRNQVLSSRDIPFSRHSTNLRNVRDVFGVDVQIGHTVSTLFLDTGSPFTWVPSPGFECVSTDGKQLKPDACPYTAYSTSNFSGGRIDGPILNFTLADGSGASGPRGYEKISLAGIHVDRQEIAICDHVKGREWPKKQIGGSMGFSFPNTDTQKLPGNFTYTPWPFTAYHQGLIDPPVFSVALNPGSKESADFAENGVLAIGGLPPNVKTTGSWAITPVVSEDADGVKRYWSMIPDGFTVMSNENPQGKFVPWTQQAEYIPGLRRLQTDSGTWGIYLPQAYINEIYKSIDPAPYKVAGQGWIANCNASYAGASIRIGGVDIHLERATVITSQSGDDLEPGQCYLGIATGGGLLGSNFLRNVVAVHDMTKGEEKMMFKQRVFAK